MIRTEYTAKVATTLLKRKSASLALTLITLSVTAVSHYYAKHELLLYGDAVAHINIARRVVDNRHPLESFGELGTVWLPLQHLAMLPFVWSDSLWRSGIAGAIPGMFAYVLGALGIFRLVNSRAPAIVAYIATGIYALNPNLLYMQGTAMNEPIFLAFFIWTLVYLAEFLRSSSSNFNTPFRQERTSPNAALEACGMTLAGGAFTRYDGWFVGLAVAVVIVLSVAAWWQRTTEARLRRAMAKSVVEFLLLNALVPVFWLIYNNRVSGHALDFLFGPYSPTAIAMRTTPHGAPPYPGQGHVLTAALYFLKSSQLNVGAPVGGRLLLIAALTGTVVAVWRFHRYGSLLLLWLPLPFYALSLAYGSVPIFMPVWYPFSYYNVRYGLELLPAFAVFIAIFAGFLFEQTAGSRSKAVAAWVPIALVAVAYWASYREKPITLQEALVNSRDRLPVEQALGAYLASLPRPATILMYESDHVGALQQAGIPLRQVISESSHPEWEGALINPPGDADYIVVCQGDPVSVAIEQSRTELPELASFASTRRSGCGVYLRPPRATAQDLEIKTGNEHENKR